MIKVKNIIMKERIWINRVAQRKTICHLKEDQSEFLEERRLKDLHSHEWSHMETWNWVPGDLVKLALGDLIRVDCWTWHLDTSQMIVESLLVTMRKGNKPLISSQSFVCRETA